MKFFIFVLFGLCAFTSASDIYDDIPLVEFLTYQPMILPRSGDFEVAAQVNDYMEKSTNEYNELVQKYNDIADSFRRQVENISEDESDLAKNRFSSVMEKISNMAKKGVKYATCTSEHQNELMEVANHATDSVKSCATEIAEALKVLAKEVSSAGIQLGLDFWRLKNIAVECYGKNKLSAAKCFYDNFSEMKDLISKIISGARTTLEAFVEHSFELIETVKQCREVHLHSAMVQFDEVKAVIENCANA